MKVQINTTIDPDVVTLYSHRTGKLIAEIPVEGVKVSFNGMLQRGPFCGIP